MTWNSFLFLTASNIFEPHWSLDESSCADRLPKVTFAKACAWLRQRAINRFMKYHAQLGLIFNQAARLILFALVGKTNGKKRDKFSSVLILELSWGLMDPGDNKHQSWKIRKRRYQQQCYLRGHWSVSCYTTAALLNWFQPTWPESIGFIVLFTSPKPKQTNDWIHF